MQHRETPGQKWLTEQCRVRFSLWEQLPSGLYLPFCSHWKSQQSFCNAVHLVCHIHDNWTSTNHFVFERRSSVQYFGAEDFWQLSVHMSNQLRERRGSWKHPIWRRLQSKLCLLQNCSLGLQTGKNVWERRQFLHLAQRTHNRMSPKVPWLLPGQQALYWSECPLIFWISQDDPQLAASCWQFRSWTLRPDVAPF